MTVVEPNERTWLSRQCLADRWDIPVKTLAEWATKGTGPRYARFGKHCRYRLVDVLAFEHERLRAGGGVNSSHGW
jgi:hypothetical protein